MTKSELTAFLDAEIAAFPGQVSLLMVDLNSRKDLLSYNSDAPVSSASLIKVPILLTAVELVTQGALSLEQSVPVGQILADTRVFEPENLRPEYPLGELLEWMTILSDNTATNAVIDLLGMDAVNEFCRRVGAQNTVLQRKMLDFASQAAGRDNRTSARDQFRFFSLLTWCADRSAVWKSALEMLQRQRCQDCFLRYICGPAVVAHKTGSLDHVNHDCGVFLDQSDPYYLGILTWDGPARDGESTQKRFIGKLSKAIYDCHMEGTL